MLNCISEWEMVDHKLNGSKYIILGNKKGGERRKGRTRRGAYS
jgi:hypothetical protein